MVAAAVLDELQVAVAVMSLVELSLYFAVAVNCWVAPVAIEAGFGETEMDVSVGVTVRTAVP